MRWSRISTFTLLFILKAFVKWVSILMYYFSVIMFRLCLAQKVESLNLKFWKKTQNLVFESSNLQLQSAQRNSWIGVYHSYSKTSECSRRYFQFYSFSVQVVRNLVLEKWPFSEATIPTNTSHLLSCTESVLYTSTWIKAVPRRGWMVLKRTESSFSKIGYSLNACIIISISLFYKILFFNCSNVIVNFL